MATYTKNLLAARDNLSARILEMTVNPKPNYSIDGESFSWADLFRALNDQLKAINEALPMAEGGFEVRSRGVP